MQIRKAAVEGKQRITLDMTKRCGINISFHFVILFLNFSLFSWISINQSENASRLLLEQMRLLSQSVLSLITIFITFLPPFSIYVNLYL